MGEWRARASGTRTRTRSVGRLEQPIAHGAEGKIAMKEVGERADRDPPLDQLMRLLQEKRQDVAKGESVVYWMRMEDMRSE